MLFLTFVAVRPPKFGDNTLFCIIALLTFVDSFENEFDLKLSSSYEVGVVNTDY